MPSQSWASWLQQNMLYYLAATGGTATPVGTEQITQPTFDHSLALHGVGQHFTSTTLPYLTESSVNVPPKQLQNVPINFYKGTSDSLVPIDTSITGITRLPTSPNPHFGVSPNPYYHEQPSFPLELYKQPNPQANVPKAVAKAAIATGQTNADQKAVTATPNDPIAAVASEPGKVEPKKEPIKAENAVVKPILREDVPEAVAAAPKDPIASDLSKMEAEVEPIRPANPTAGTEPTVASNFVQEATTVNKLGRKFGPAEKTTTASLDSSKRQNLPRPFGPADNSIKIEEIKAKLPHHVDSQTLVTQKVDPVQNLVGNLGKATKEAKPIDLPTTSAAINAASHDTNLRSVSNAAEHVVQQAERTWLSWWKWPLGLFGTCYGGCKLIPSTPTPTAPVAKKASTFFLKSAYQKSLRYLQTHQHDLIKAGAIGAVSGAIGAGAIYTYKTLTKPEPEIANHKVVRRVKEQTQ